MGSRPFGVDRYAPLRRLHGATRFSDDRDLRDPVQVVRFLRAQPELIESIERGFGLRHDPDDPASERAAFDIRKFHAHLLDYGSMPLGVLTGHVDCYIAERHRPR